MKPSSKKKDTNMKALNIDTLCKIATPFTDSNYHDVAALIATLGLAGALSEDAILSEKLLNVALVFSELHDEHDKLGYSKYENIIRRHALMEEVRGLVSERLSMDEMRGVYQFV